MNPAAAAAVVAAGALGYLAWRGGFIQVDTAGLPFATPPDPFREDVSVADVERNSDIVLDAAGFFDLNIPGADLVAGLEDSQAGFDLFQQGGDVLTDAAQGLLHPLAGARLSSPFGWRQHPILGIRKFHTGIDLATAAGTPIRAAETGTVSVAGNRGTAGNMVQIDHAGGLKTRYMHLSRLAVSKGAVVSRGQIIGYVGSTGRSTGPHLHFETLRNGKHVNPLEVIQ